MTFQATKAQSVSRILKDIEGLQNTLTALQSHTEEDCKAGKHLWAGIVTGGSRGEMLHYCRACNHEVYGYD